jgi:indolepyruvate ferredoxin oxidoreductase
VNRVPFFCSGCPHNTSTRLPEGSRGLAGIGCHYMVRWMDRDTDAFTQMGAEGANWVGQAPFCNTKHVFVNIGDGTYFHSGILAVRACVAAGVNITFKVLYNDAVAMTGGQPMDGPLDPARITRQLHAEGVSRIIVVTEDTSKYPIGTNWAPGVDIRPREELDSVQRDLRELSGTTVLLYDQTCAAEKRRRRKRGAYPDPDRRVFINAEVCEGCGDCSKTSNCLSVLPLETSLGRKRQIEQSSCNKDYSCLQGFCPSFVTVHGGRLRRNEGRPDGAEPWPDLPEPSLPDLASPYGIMITGVGGTGIVTLGALIAMAAHIEGKSCTTLDITGLAQKGGAVTSQIRIAAKQSDLHAVRIAAGGARLLLGCDLVVAASFDARSKLDPKQSRAIVNTQEAITGEFMRDPAFRIPSAQLRGMIDHAVGSDAADYVDATRLATALMGDAIATNLFMLGYAWQKSLIPVGLAALKQAIELNGVAVQANLRSFLWGRRAAVDPAEVAKRAFGDRAEEQREAAPASFEEIVSARARYLVDYQDDAYAQRYRDLLNQVAAREAALGLSGNPLGQAVAEGYFKLLAYKDEYEVARLYLSRSFRSDLEKTFEGGFTLRYHLAPPLLARRDPESGHLLKREFGPWLRWVFRLLAPLKRLRGGPLDLFGYTRERRQERQLIADYESLMKELLGGLSRSKLACACELASLPLEIRGFGHVKDAAIERAAKRRHLLLQEFRSPETVDRHEKAAE